VKQTLVVKLAPTPEQAGALLRTLETFNAACNDIAGTAFAQRSANKIELQKLVYYYIRERFGLSAQMCIRAISKVSEAYKRDREKRPTFRQHGAMTYDERILSFPRVDRASLLTLEGRAEMPFRFGAYQEARLDRIRGQADLLYRNGVFFLACTVDAPEQAPDEASEYLGVDLGVVNIAVTSDGEIVNRGQRVIVHAHVNTVRARYARLRAKVQKKGTKSAKRLLKKRSGRERRHARDVNHCISKALVSTAKDTDRGIALENLTHIRSRITVEGKRQRRVLHSWAFGQLRSFIAYKAQMAGVRVALVNPAYTSQTCSQCGHCEQANRKSQSHFLCVSCGFSAHADANAAVNIGRKAAVIPPHAAPLAG
jgi:IS605 OrfB family transposase